MKVREYFKQEIESLERYKNHFGTLRQAQSDDLLELQNDLAWINTDEVRPVWTLQGGCFACGGITYCRKQHAEDWIANCCEAEGCDCTIEESRMAGREFGDLPFNEDW